MSELNFSPRRFMRLFILTIAAATIVSAADRRVSFDANWKFLKGDAAGADQPGFNDQGWRSLDLPHDWAIEGPFDAQYGASTGGLPISGTGWYRKHFTVPASGRSKYYSLEIDGAMSNSTVYLNGHSAGGRPYGYSSFEVDLTPYMKFGEENVLAVRLTPEPQSSRWYPGAGIYRNVWLVTTEKYQVAHWGTYVTTPKVTDESATVEVKSEIQNHESQNTRLTVEIAVLDAAGKQVAHSSSERHRGGQRFGHRQRFTECRPPRAVGREPPLFVQSGDHREIGRGDSRPVRTALRHPHHRIHPREGIPAQRPRDEAKWRVRSPRPGRLGSRHQHARARNASWRFFEAWASTPSVPATTRPRPSFSTCATARDSW